LPVLTSAFFFLSAPLPTMTSIFISLRIIFTSFDNNIIIIIVSVVGSIIIVGLPTCLGVALPICISAESVATVARNGFCHIL